MISNRRSGRPGRLALVAFALAGCGGSMPAAETAGAEHRTVTVVGRGEARGKPDIARASIGVEAQSQDIGEVVDKVNEQATKIIAAIEAIGVADSDVRTSSFYLYAEHPPREPTPVQHGKVAPEPTAAPATIYHAGNSVEVVVRDMAKVSDVLGAAIHAGANSISGLSFDIADPAPLQTEAREKAFASARDAAGALARLGGVALGPLVSMSEAASAPSHPGFFARDSAVASTPIQPGELTVRHEVEVVYGLSSPAAP